MNCTRGAVPRDAIHWNVEYVVSGYDRKPTRAEHVKNVEFLANLYKETVPKITKAHSLRTITWELQRAREQRKNALDYAKFFNVKAPKLVPIPTITAERRAKALAFDAGSEERRARIRSAREARWNAELAEYEKRREQERENARKTLPERIAKWKQGEYVGYLGTDYALLRLVQKDGATHVQTSQGVSVPVSGHAGAARLFRFLKALVDAGREYQRNGHTEHIGAFAVDSFKVEETTWLGSAPQSQYVLTAGCHRIAWSEIQNISDAVLAAEQKEGQSKSTMKTMAQFIEENRAELVAAIVRCCPNVRQPLDDEDLEQWIMNDEGLYQWALSERVDVDGDEDEENEKEDSVSLWESESRK